MGETLKDARKSTQTPHSGWLRDFYTGTRSGGPCFVFILRLFPRRRCICTGVWGFHPPTLRFSPTYAADTTRLALGHVWKGQMKTELSTDITDVYPLTPMQQGMLFHGLSSMGGAGTDVEQIFCRLHEELDAGAFRLAWQGAIDRHAVLRTSFHWLESAGPRQRVHSQVEFEFSEHDWRDVPETEGKTLFAGHLEAERTRGF